MEQKPVLHPTRLPSVMPDAEGLIDDSPGPSQGNYFYAALAHTLRVLCKSFIFFSLIALMCCIPVSLLRLLFPLFPYHIPVRPICVSIALLDFILVFTCILGLSSPVLSGTGWLLVFLLC